MYQQSLGTPIATRCAPPYTCIFMDEVQSMFKHTQRFQPLVA